MGLRSNKERNRSKSTGETPAQQQKHEKGIVQIERENIRNAPSSPRDKKKPEAKATRSKLYPKNR